MSAWRITALGLGWVQDECAKEQVLDVGCFTS